MSLLDRWRRLWSRGPGAARRPPEPCRDATPGPHPGPRARHDQHRIGARHDQHRIDALTGLPNRLALDELLHAVAGEGERRASRVAVAFIDVDHLGDYNRLHGDAAGDASLHAVARAIRAGAGAGDALYRKGSDEFVILLPEADGHAAAAVGERVRGAVESLGLVHPAAPAPGVVTVTVGVASGPPGAGLRQLLGAAAARAMAGKQDGRRNQVHAVRLEAPADPSA